MHEKTDRVLEICDNVVAILLLLETCKGHGRTWDELGVYTCQRRIPS